MHIKKVIEFTHSLPSYRPTLIEYPFSMRYVNLENAIFAYPTYSGLIALKNQYDMPIENCKAIYNCLPILDDLDESVRKLSLKTDLLTVDILAIYPARLTTGKRHEKIAILLGAIKKYTKKSVKIVYADFKSSDIFHEDYKKIIIDKGIESGLSKDDIVFTSECGFPDGFPRKGVLDLFTLSNLFICPSFSESFGLTVIEASSRGNFLVINEKVPALKELGTNLNAYFMKWDGLNFSFQTTETYFPSEEAYNKDNAIEIIRQMDNNAVLKNKAKIRTLYSTDWIFKNQMSPILYD